MEIILGSKAGFCFGVENAINKTLIELEKNNKLYCLGELVHNKEVIKSLEEKGLTFINSLEEIKDNVIIRAHGEKKETYDYLRKKNINVYDFTCPMVLKIHNIVKKYNSDGYFILLIGGKKHPESIGTISYCDNNSYLAETKEDIEKAIEKIKTLNIKKMLVIVQSTFSVEKFNIYVEYIKDSLNDEVLLEVKNTICTETKKRQEETEEISKKVDAMIIIGGKNSSNTKELYNMSSKNCVNTFIIETECDLDFEKIKNYNKVGIMAGASTPKKSIYDVIDKIKRICK